MSLTISCWNCGYTYDPFRQGKICPNCNCSIDPNDAERTQFDEPEDVGGLPHDSDCFWED